MKALCDYLVMFFKRETMHAVTQGYKGFAVLIDDAQVRKGLHDFFTLYFLAC
jgi:hypothetical protein